MHIGWADFKLQLYSEWMCMSQGYYDRFMQKKKENKNVSLFGEKIEILV